MNNHRLTHIAAVALAIAATAAPAASAEPQDLRNADNRVPETQPQDLRNADTRDYAEGRGTYNSPDVVVVDSPKPVAEPASGGVHWEDVGIGAGGLLGVTLAALGGTLFIVHRRGTRPLTS